MCVRERERERERERNCCSMDDLKIGHENHSTFAYFTKVSNLCLYFKIVEIQVYLLIIRMGNNSGEVCQKQHTIKLREHEGRQSFRSSGFHVKVSIWNISISEDQI